MNLSVKDFAEAAGVSPQAIYKRLGTDLKPFIEYEDGKRMLNSAALDKFPKKVSQIADEVDNSSKDDSTEYLHQIELLKVQLTAAEDKISIRDQQISDLHDQLRQKDEQIKSLDQRLHESNAVQLSLTATIAAMKPGGIGAWFRNLLPGKKTQNDTINAEVQK